MRIHQLNCGTDHSLGGALLDDCSHGPLGKLACHPFSAEVVRARLQELLPDGEKPEPLKQKAG